MLLLSSLFLERESLGCPAWDKTKELILQVVHNSCGDSEEYPESLTEARLNRLQNQMHFPKNKALPVWTAEVMSNSGRSGLELA